MENLKRTGAGSTSRTLAWLTPNSNNFWCDNIRPASLTGLPTDNEFWHCFQVHVHIALYYCVAILFKPDCEFNYLVSIPKPPFIFPSLWAVNHDTDQKKVVNSTLLIYTRPRGLWSPWNVRFQACKVQDHTTCLRSHSIRILCAFQERDVRRSSTGWLAT